MSTLLIKINDHFLLSSTDIRKARRFPEENSVILDKIAGKDLGASHPGLEAFLVAWFVVKMSRVEFPYTCIQPVQVLSARNLFLDNFCCS